MSLSPKMIKCSLDEQATWYKTIKQFAITKDSFTFITFNVVDIFCGESFRLEKQPSIY